MLVKSKSRWDFPGGPVVENLPFCYRGIWVQSLVRELRSLMLCGQKKKKNILKWIQKFLRSDEQVVKSASAGYQGHSQEFPWDPGSMLARRWGLWHSISQIKALMLLAWTKLTAGVPNHSARSKNFFKKPSQKCCQLPSEPAWMN